MHLTSGVCGIYYAFPWGPTILMKRSAKVLTNHHSHTSSIPSALSSSVTLHSAHVDPFMDHLWPLWPLCQGTGTTPPTVSHLAPDRRIQFSTTQHWSGNRLSSSAESSSLEQARRNGDIQHRTSHTIIMMKDVLPDSKPMVSKHWRQLWK